MKVEKKKFDAALSALLKADPIPFSEIVKKKGKVYGTRSRREMRPREASGHARDFRLAVTAQEQGA